MSNIGVREIRGHQATRVMPDLIHSLLAAELVAPSAKIWLVSPWITDVRVLRNEAGEFALLAPAWENRGIRLSEVLNHLMSLGTDLTVATRRGGNSSAFINALVRQDGACLNLCYAERLHEKGLLTDEFFLSGSFNFTHSGITLNEEIAYLYRDPAMVAENRIALLSRWGDA